MIKLFSLTLVLIFTISCDVPQRNRYINPGTTSISGTGDGETETTTYTTSPDKSDTSDESTVITTPSSSTDSEPGYENCNLAFSHYGGSVGYFGVCQNTSDERGFKFKFQNQYNCQGGSNMSTNCGVCFIPMNMMSNGTSFMVGPAQCVHNNADQAYYGTFSKTRSEPINATIVIHRTSLDAFIQCSNAKSDYLSQCYGGAYNQACVTAAENYAYQVCTSFTQQHSAHYKQVSF